MKPARTRGFTLVELLVALTILAMISVLSWRGLDSVIRGRNAATSIQDRTLAITSALDQMAIDLRNSSPANVAIVTAPQPGADAMQFVRSVPDPGGAQRQVRIQWRLVENVLTRLSSEEGAETFSQPALGQVQSMAVRIYAGGRWISSEELAKAGAASPGPIIGVAVLLGLAEGEITRTFVVGGL
jgi:general secretion pathway protein J